MPKKGINIHKRNDGRWEGRYKIGVYQNGSTKYTSVYGQSYKEVKEKLILLMSGKKILLSQDREKLFSEVLGLWFDNNRLKHKGATEHKYLTMIEKHIDPELGALKLSQISSVMINSFLDRKLKAGRLDGKGGLSPSYVRTMSQIIQSALRFAAEEEWCQPLKSSVYKPVSEKKEPNILSKEDQERLEFFLLSRYDPVCLGIMLSLYAGLRIGEICALSWDDIDLEERVIHVRHTIARVRNTTSEVINRTVLIIDTPKTNSSLRDIPISSVLLTYLTVMKQNASHGFVLSDTHSFVRPRTFEYRFHRLLEEGGIKQINYHALRHTFATRCIEAGVDAKSLSEMLGHAHVGITLNTYVHSSMDMKRMQIEKLHSAV